MAAFHRFQSSLQAAPLRSFPYHSRFQSSPSLVGRRSSSVAVVALALALALALVTVLVVVVVVVASAQLSHLVSSP